jgi:DNA-binding NtrC family response regulator
MGNQGSATLPSNGWSRVLEKGNHDMQSKPRLLIVDDELLIRDLLYDYFASRDFDIAVADSGRSALSLLEESHFDTVILDLKMPDMDGLQLTQKIRADDNDLPIILITGYPSFESAIDALRQRVHDYFTKPVNLSHLRRAVESALSRRDAVDKAETMP